MEVYFLQNTSKELLLKRIFQLIRYILEWTPLSNIFTESIHAKKVEQVTFKKIRELQINNLFLANKQKTPWRNNNNYYFWLFILSQTTKAETTNVYKEKSLHFVQVLLKISHSTFYIYINFIFCKFVKYCFNYPIFEMCYVCINSIFVFPGTSRPMWHNACAVPFASFCNIKEKNNWTIPSLLLSIK